MCSGCVLKSMHLNAGCFMILAKKRSFVCVWGYIPLVWRKADRHNGGCVKLVPLENCDPCPLVHYGVVDTEHGYVIILPSSPSPSLTKS